MIRVGKLGIVRRTGKDMTQLRLDVFERDTYRCQHILSQDSEFIPGVGIAIYYNRCLKSVTWESGHLAHKIGRGRGGSDTMENCLTKCAHCHLVLEHNPKSVPPKERV